MHSVVRHRRFETGGYDLGIFEQAVKGYAHLGPPYATLKGDGFNLLGDHFHPVLVLIAPFYRLAPTPVTLLVVQAALLAVSVHVVAVAARRELGATAGLLVGTGYALSWGIWAAVAYDFHEVAFATPMIALAADALLRGRYRTAAAWGAALVVVKEDLPATTIVLGLLIFWYGHRRLGVATAVFGALSLALIVGVVLPALSPTGEYAYWSKAGVADGAGGAGIGVKLWGVALLLIPVLFLALRSPLLLLAAPTVGWHLVSTNPAYSGTRFHYAVTLMPIVFLAAVDGLRRLDRLRWAPAVIAVLGVVFALTGPPGNMLRPAWWRPAPYAVAGAKAIAVIPAGARVVALNRLAAQLTATHVVFLLDAGLRDQLGRTIDADWVVAETSSGRWPISAEQRRALLDDLRRCGYETVYDRDNFVTLRRAAGGPRGAAFEACLAQ